MKRLALIGLAFALSGTWTYAGPESIQTSGKEMKTMVAPIAAEEFSWSGFYIGGRAGYGWHDGDIDTVLLPGILTIEPRTQDNSSDGFIGGGEIGFNWQLNRFVFGVETDFSGADIDGESNHRGTFAPTTFTFSEPVHHEINWFGTARGRVGFALIQRLLLYGTGGLVYADVEQSAGLVVPVANYVNSRSDAEFGWTAGGGIEFALNRHWSVKAEYLYCDIGDESMTALPVPPRPPFRIRYDWDNTFQTVTAGVNFRF